MSDPSRAWRYADLRLLDGLDGPKPGQDIIAAYARVSGADIEIRVDLLQSRSTAEYDLYLAVDSQPGGRNDLPVQGQGGLAWEAWIGFPTGARSMAVLTDGEKAAGLIPRLYRDLDLDAAIVRLNQKDLGMTPARLRFQVFLTDPAQTRVVEQTGVFSLDDLPPRRAPLLLAFWNTLPAQTPAITLRRWNGAHTGPAGHRHGLAQILQAVEQTGVPVTLLDLKTPDSLAGLDQVNGLKQVQRLAARGLLTLPDAAFGDPLAAGTALQISRETGLRFGLQASPAAYAPFYEPPASPYRLIFSSDPEFKSPSRVGGTRVLPLPAAGDVQPDANGLTVAMRKTLLAAALQPDPPLTVLGGDVQQTMWADAEVAAKALGDISNHPWMQPFSGNDLLTLPAENQAQLPVADGCQNILCAQDAGSAGQETLRANMRQSIQDIADPDWRELTWMMYLRLTQPTADPARAALQAGYLGQVGYLLAAADWLRSPVAAAGCAKDLDDDGQAECVLSSGQIFTILEADGARLALAVTLDNGRPREWIGPSSQFAVGLGAPDAWQPERPQGGDPQVIPGGLADLPDSFVPYTPVVGGQAVTFNGPGGAQKIYRLAGSRIEVEYRGSAALTTRIPLLLGSGEPRGPGWGMRFFSQTGGGRRSYRWWSAEQAGVSVQAGAAVQAQGPLDSFALMHSPEDPDREYPPGHFLPYPVVEVQIQADGPFTVSIGPE